MDSALHVMSCHYLAALRQTVWPSVEVPPDLHKIRLLGSCILGSRVVSPVFLYVQLCLSSCVSQKGAAKLWPKLCQTMFIVYLAPPRRLFSPVSVCLSACLSVSVCVPVNRITQKLQTTNQIFMKFCGTVGHNPGTKVSKGQTLFRD